MKIMISLGKLSPEQLIKIHKQNIDFNKNEIEKHSELGEFDEVDKHVENLEDHIKCYKYNKNKHRQKLVRNTTALYK